MKLDGTTVLVGLGGLLIGGAAMMFMGPWLRPAADPDPPKNCLVRVFAVDGDHLVVDHEPVHKKGCNNGEITWKATHGWKFPDKDSIKLKSSLAAQCRLEAGDTELVCSFPNLAQGAYPYIVKIKKGNVTLDLDPMMFND